jgi:hypothetical protein
MNELEEKKKQVIGIYGEMRLSMILHELGWQVHRAYIDEGIDFTITKYFCKKCRKYSNQYIRYSTRKGKKVKCVTNLCEHCKKTELEVISRYLQVKTSEGIATNNENVRKFSFHPKIRYDMGNEVFYVWIAIFDEPMKEKICHFYIFNTKDVKKFDNINLPTYQVTDNQKTELPIRKDGVVLKKGSKSTGYDYSIFNTKFYYNFKALEIEINNNGNKKLYSKK